MTQINTDIAVIGAGPAGVCAAIAAAKLGKKVVLAGNRPVLGGNTSSEIRVWSRGATGGGNLFAEEMGIWGELKMRNLYTNLSGNPVFWSEILLDRVLKEENITLLLNTHILNLEKQGERVESVTGFQMGTEQQYKIAAKMFIDCTGDGTLGAQAGVPFTKGKESRSVYEESYAPISSDNTTQGNSILFFIKKTERKTAFIPPDYAYSIEKIEELIGAGGRVVGPEYSGSDYWWFETGGNMDTIANAQEISIELKKLVMGVWNYIKNSGKFDADYITLEWFGSVPGKRESRRMKTDYILTQKDVETPTDFYDGAFYGGWYIDFHPSDGIYAKNDSCKQLPINVYQIPLRCLYNSSVPNLFFAGRNIGASHVAFASSRIMNTCALSGQAAATLASECINQNSVPGKADVNIVVQKLLAYDMFIPGKKNCDALDKARFAKISASSKRTNTITIPTDTFALVNGAFMVLPKTSSGSYSILTQSSKPTKLHIKLYANKVPSRISNGPCLGAMELEVKQGQNETLLALPPIEKEGFVVLDFEQNDFCKIYVQREETTGVLLGNADNPNYYYPCVKFDCKDIYDEKNVADGYNRPYGMPHSWVSGTEEKPFVTLEWEKEQSFDEIRLAFNPSLCQEIPSSRAEKWSDEHKFAARESMPPQLIKSFSVYVQANNQWQLIFEEKQNWKRLACVKLEKTYASKAIKIVFNSSYGAPFAEVFEIRVYDNIIKE